MSVNSFVPEIWSASLLASLKKASVFANLANRNYEGDISQAGDTVHITAISRPTIAAYVPNVTTITPEVLASTDRILTIDQAKFFAFEVDDVDLRQAKGNVIDMAMQEAAFGLVDDMDIFIAKLYSQIASANIVSAGGVAVLTGDAAYSKLTLLSQKLDEANVTRQQRWAVIPPWYLALLLDTNKVAWNAGVPALAEAAAVQAKLVGGTVATPLAMAYCGKVLGMDIYVSNNVVNIAANRWAVMAGTADAWTVAEQINKVEAYRPQTTFADAVRGLHLYGAKVTRPDGLAYLDASST